MTEEHIDFASVLETGGKAALRRWQGILENGGNKTVSLECEHCGQRTRMDVPVADVDQERRIIELLAEYTKTKPRATDEAKTQGDLTKLWNTNRDAIPDAALIREAFAGDPSEIKEWTEWAKRRKTGKPSK